MMTKLDPSGTDLRGFLHYVPLFRGKTFILDVDWNGLSTSARAELVLDLCALQSIGVQLVIVASTEELENILDWALEHEFRTSVLTSGLNGPAVARVLARGQAAMVSRDRGLFSENLMALARDLSVAKVIIVNDFSLRDDSGEVLRFLTADEAGDNLAHLSASHGDQLEMAVEACRSGVDRVHLLDGSEPGVVLKELFSNEGVGTMVYGGVYRQIRMLKEEDISELLGLIGRSVRRTQLVPRTYEQVLESLSDYAVIEVDGNVLGCVALYAYEDVGEIACLYVKQTHEGTGYGKDLVEFMEKRALKLGLTSVFALTNSASTFFEQKLGYHQVAIDTLPKVRRDSLASSGRSSQAYLKVFC